MNEVIPHAFMFRYAISVSRCPDWSPEELADLDLPANCRLPDLQPLTGQSHFADVRVAWNDAGLLFSVSVEGKRHPPASDVKHPTEADGLQVWIDTRDTQNIHRASRYCHHFCLLPTRPGKRRSEPVAIQVPMDHDRARSKPAEQNDIALNAVLHKYGYRLAAAIPAETLIGYEPESHPRLGFYYTVRDAELGEQFLTVGREFPFAHDPSLWSTLRLES